MKELIKANTPHARLPIRGQILLVLVCLAMAWLGFWAYTVLADVPAAGVGTEAGTPRGSSAPDEGRAQNTTATMRISPANSWVDAGQSFSITVAIDGVTNLGGFQFDLNYDSSVVEVTEPYTDHVTLGPFLGSTGRPVNEIGPDKVSEGLIRYAAWSGPSSLSGPSGSGTLATIAFDAGGLGTSPLSLQSVSVTDTEGGEIIPTVQGGQVTVGTGPGEDISVYLPIVLKSH